MTARVYVSGAMTGIPDLNRPLFNSVTARLRAMGHQVINPAEVQLPEGATWADFMRADIALMMSCTRIHMLPGWEASRGAVIEHDLAVKLGFDVTFEPGAKQAA